ncbi:MAG: hypothetical protein ABW252_10940 [Polyangiales bacterium]
MGKLLAVLNALIVVVYPVAVYFSLTRLGARGAGLVLAALLLPGIAQRLRSARREDLLAVLRLPLSVLALLGLAAALDDPRLVLALPVLINLALLAQFASSLWGTPLVERFARMQQANLGPAQVAYCRAVTKVWCGFFLLNGGTAAALALSAPLSWWTLYNGLLAYVAMGVLGASEYVVRKARFREYGPGLHDRLLARIFPPHAEAPR